MTERPVVPIETNDPPALPNLNMDLSWRPRDASLGRVAGGLTLTLRVTNIGDTPMRIRFPTSQQFDITIHNTNGEKLWAWSADRMFLTAVCDRELAPGEAATYEVHWDGRSGDAHVLSAPGRYRAIGRFLGEVEGAAPHVSVDIVVDE